MTKPVYLPLVPGTKRPAVEGWAKPDYRGVEPEGRVGLRADALVIADCDSEEAYQAWIALHPEPTEVNKTPRGYHAFYETDAETANEIGPRTGVIPGVDIRAGSGSFVVAPPTEGYERIGRRKKRHRWDDAWRSGLRHLDPNAHANLIEGATEDWDLIPVGQQNSTLTALAGTLRRQGASAAFIYATLQQFAEGALENGDPSNPWTNEDLKLIARSVARYEPDPDTTFLIEDEGTGTELVVPGSTGWPGVQLSDMKMPPPPKWHWPRYIPQGRLVMVDGAEGIGKGLFGTHLAIRLTGAGTPVLWASTEDDPEEDIQRRIKAAGWDAKTYADVTFMTVDPRFPTNTAEIEEWIAEAGFGMLILDPGRSFLEPPEGSKGMSYNDEAFIRPGLEALNRMAKRTGCTVIFVHHWNKNSQASVKLRQGGSGAFGQIVRHRITLAWHGPTDGGQGAFEVSKSNIAPTGGVHSYMVDASVEYDTAVFQLGVPMPEYVDLGAWMKDVEADGSIEIERADDVEAHVLALPPGSKVDPVEIAGALGTSVGQVDEQLMALYSTGVLRRGAHKVLVRAE